MRSSWFLSILICFLMPCFIFQVSEEAKYLKSLKSDRDRQLQDFRDRMDEKISLEFNNKKAFEEEAQSLLHAIHASDESRRTSFLLSQEEEHQNVTVCYLLLNRI